MLNLNVTVNINDDVDYKIIPDVHKFEDIFRFIFVISYN